MSVSGSETESETEFVTEDVPVTKTMKGLQARKNSLALAREKKVRQQKVVRNTKEVHDDLNKARALTEKAQSSLAKAKLKSEEIGITVPTMEAPKIDPMFEMMKMMRDEINSLKTKAEPKHYEPKAEPKPKVRVEPKPKVVKPELPAPVPVTLAPVPPKLNPYEQKRLDQNNRLEILKKALGRK